MTREVEEMVGWKHLSTFFMVIDKRPFISLKEYGKDVLVLVLLMLSMFARVNVSVLYVYHGHGKRR